MSFTITLLEPEIPPNTGNIARLCAATGASLELVGRLGFKIDDKAVRRAGLDYWDQVDLIRVEALDSLMENLDPERIHLFTTKTTRRYWEARYNPGDRLIFGPETRGIDEIWLNRYKGRLVTVPQWPGRVRSLNLSNVAALGLYEALRQNQGLIP